VTRLLVRGGRVLDPASERNQPADVLIEGGRIAAVGSDLEARGAEVVDASDCWVAPGFVDMHTHLREPGQEYKEDIASGGRAAVAGGFTAVACMANTDPVNDDPAVTEFILGQARQDCPARVYPIAAATKGLEGEVMTEMSAGWCFASDWRNAGMSNLPLSAAISTELSKINPTAISEPRDPSMRVPRLHPSTLPPRGRGEASLSKRSDNRRLSRILG